MSSPFPYIRLKGDKAAAALHLRRAMGELFKTERIAELAGVPILKRTVPIDSHNSIEVHISKEQKFVYITSIPVLPGEEVEERGEKPFDVSQCPPGFIVRKLSWEERFPTDSLNQTKYKGDGGYDGYPGHIIAYDGKEWRSAKYDEINLGAFEGATNCGWWHLGEAVKTGKLDEADYNACDVITWHGGHGGLVQTTKNSSSDARTGQESIQKVNARQYLEPYFYHGGKRIEGPGNVLCACILKENNVDYYYVLWCNITNVWTSTGSGIAYHTVGSQGGFWVSRKRVSGTGSWEYLHFIDPQDPATNPSPSLRVDYDPTDGEFQLPWGTGYCDTEGNAYFTQIFYGEKTQTLKEGYTVLTQHEGFRLAKIDLRSGKIENLAEQIDGYMKEANKVVDYDTWGGPWTYNAPPSEPTAKTAGGNSSTMNEWLLEEPAFIGMWGGGQDLYTYWIEPFLLSTNGYGDIISVPAEQYTHYYVDLGGNPKQAQRYTREDTVRRSETGSGTIVMTCYKMKNGNVRGELHDSLVVFDQTLNMNLKHEYTSALQEHKRNVTSGGWEGTHEHYIMAAHVFDHNPEIKNSWEYATRELQVNGESRTSVKKIKYHRDGKVLHSDEVTHTQGPHYTTNDPFTGGGDNALPFIGPGWTYQKMKYSDEWYSPGLMATVYAGRTVLDADIGGAQVAVQPSGISYFAGTHSGYSLAGEFITEQNRSYGHWYGYIKICDHNISGDYRWQPGWGQANWYEGNQPGSWPMYEGGGGPTHIVIAQASINEASENRTLYRPTLFAVHRPVEGMKEKPYIRMRRKVNRHPRSMASYPLVPVPSLDHPQFGQPTACHGWDTTYLSYEPNGPEGENGKAVSSAMQSNSWFSNYLDYGAWRWWCEAAGNAKDGYKWDDWEIDCNFMSKDQINKLVGYDEEIDKGAENMFFEIAVL